MNLFDEQISVNQFFKSYDNGRIVIDVKRDDLLHPTVSGNKLRKLKYNLIDAIEQDYEQIITYGGAYSNHIAATAAACRILGLRSVGIIRGEELAKNVETHLQKNDTLKTAHENGMVLDFVSREHYKHKNKVAYQEELIQRYGRSRIIPEGGTNKLAVKGTAEIITKEDLSTYDVICVAAGTGGTAAGIIKTAAATHKVLVFSALKGDFLKEEIKQLAPDRPFQFFSEDSFGGYARSSDQLIEYLNLRFRESGIPLDPIYTGKMMYKLEQFIEQGFFNGKTRILAIHTGGLQGVSGYNQKLLRKNRLLIDYEDYI